MNEPPKLEGAAPAPPVAPMPLLARMMNVFAVPGEVFENVRKAPTSLSSWLVPLVLAACVSVVSAQVLFSRPALVAQVRELQDRQMTQQREKLQKRVEEGKLKQAQADRALEGMEKMMELTSSPSFLKITGSISGAVFSMIQVFGWAFLLWLMALLLLRHRVLYPKALEVSGLALMIGTLGDVVKLLLQVNLGRSTATPSLALAVSEFDPGNRLHLVLGALNLVDIWMVLVLAIGLARLAQVPFARAAMLLMGFWILQEGTLILLGAGLASM
jgi:hypothetical protein